MLKSFLNKIYIAKKFSVKINFKNSSFNEKHFGVQKNLSFEEIIDLLKILYKVDINIQQSYMVEKILKNMDNAISLAIIDNETNSIIWKNQLSNPKITKETVLESFINGLYIYQLIMTSLKINNNI